MKLIDESTNLRDYLTEDRDIDYSHPVIKVTESRRRWECDTEVWMEWPCECSLKS